MKKLFIIAICFLLWGAITFWYTPSIEFQERLEQGAEKINIVIQDKWEQYRENFLSLIVDYKARYQWNDKAIYILDYLYDYLDSQSISPNILLIIADDMWLDAMPGFSEWDIKPYIPHIESFMEKWVTFENLWSAPTCTPTRSTILTGKYGYHTDVLQVDDPLATSETSLQSYLDQETDDSYAHAVIGKWHLSKDASHPTEMWVWYYAGMLTWWARSYDSWKFTENGNTSTSNEYITTKFTDLAIDWVLDQDKPWFLWLAYTAPHTPFHVPPSDLHYQWNLLDDEDAIEANPTPYYMAAIEAMDSEIGRLLDSIPEDELANTTIIFMWDNGTPGQVAQSPYGRRTVKWSLHQWGINVPLVVSGYWVTRQWEREDALVNTTDMFATVSDIANTWTTSINNSISFKDALTTNAFDERDYAYWEVWNWKTAGYTIRNERYKLMVLDSWEEMFYDLEVDPYENTNLINRGLSDSEQVQKDMLEDEILDIRK